MPQSLAYNYIHLVFSTKHREHLILPEIESKLYAYITGICKNSESPALQIGGMPDHIHILFVLSKKISLVKFIEEIKKTSSKWIKSIEGGHPDFYWQDGYGAFSVSPKHIEMVKNYILSQKEHHKEKTFKEEYITFLKQYNVD
ncbi:IS200/IS605 family transposase [Flavobacterium subsaxonicum]|uniref:Transposase n=1 Tax=Flavobacterium subsaxonicum WB 4.1-42 = DSM 21790 TaxID=1121898 RepID=A0A0A2MIN0_9FLAO|nr:IS200/IS605 family transposase [Flavobacterium subsaxonicum]KGO92139.1 transposase [Flavobacterium subsaxonicum WB 4.1-42 = DSM 21790]